MKVSFIPIFFFTLVCICGCSSDSNPDAKTSDSGTIDSAIVLLIADEPESAEAPKSFRMEVPVGFSLDTIYYFDSTKITDIQILLPVSGIASLDQRMAREAEARKKEFLKDMNPSDHPATGYASCSSFFMEINSIYATDSIISYCFHVSVYPAYAAHPFSSYYSYNYNRVTGKEITFNDYFKISSHEDSVFLIQRVREAIKFDGTDFHEIKDMDFNLVNDSISFNFDDYEIGSYATGVVESRVNKKVLNPIIRKEYQ